MKTLNIKAIRTDGGTQSRAEINNEAVGEYAEAIKAGASFPAVTVFHDGTDYWLADGFHRFHATKQAGKTSIEAEVLQGTVRDAILHSLGVNDDHGLRRTSADKRKAVQIALDDSQWSKWSQEKIAKTCKVSAGLVSKLVHEAASLHGEEIKPKTRTVERSGKTYEQDTTNIGTVKPVASKPEAKPEAVKPPPPPEDDGPSAEEVAKAEREAAEELDALRKIALADDKVAEALAEAKKLRALNRVLQERNDGLMNEKAELIKRIKALQRKLDKLEQPA